jgi:hypothetical protein
LTTNDEFAQILLENSTDRTESTMNRHDLHLNAPRAFSATGLAAEAAGHTASV